jgi:hypothetical protein
VSDSLALIIVTYNSRSEIGPCLDSVVGHTAPYPATVTVVDNQSADDTAAFVREQYPSVQVIEAGGNLGFARANNLGLRATASTYVLLLNPDTIVPPAAIPTLLRALASDPDAAIAGPRLTDEHNFPELSYGPRVSPWSEFGQKVLRRLYERRVRLVVRHIDRATRTGGERAWVSGACLAAVRADLEEVGLFDERFAMYLEDVDLCAQVRKRGRKVIFAPQAEVVHLRGRSALRNPETERLRRRSHVAYYEKHLPQWAGLLRWYLKVSGKAAAH